MSGASQVTWPASSPTPPPPPVLGWEAEPLDRSWVCLAEKASCLNEAARLSSGRRAEETRQGSGGDHRPPVGTAAPAEGRSRASVALWGGILGNRQERVPGSLWACGPRLAPQCGLAFRKPPGEMGLFLSDLILTGRAGPQGLTGHTGVC